MAREKKKPEPPIEIRSVEEVVAVEFSGLKDDAPPPVEAAPPKGRAPAKPRTRKPPAAPVALLAAPAAPAPAPMPDLSAPAREAAALLESIVEKCRDAQAQLQGELEKRRAVAQEVEALRQRSHEAHEQLLRDAQEGHAAHLQILAQAREGAEHVKREHAAAAAQLTATVPETKKLLERSRGEYENMLRELGEGVTLLKRECATAAKQVAETGKQIESFRPQMQGIQESLLYEVELASAGAERVKMERAAAANQLAEAGTAFAEARRHFFEGFEQEVAKLRQRLREAGEAMQDLPSRAEELRQRLAGAGAEVREFEQSAAAARQKREALDLEATRAEERLAKLRAEANDAEGSLAGLRLELEEHRRRREAPNPAPAPAAEPAPPAPPPEPETRNQLGITVDHGIVVAEVAPGTPAAAAGLIRGDVITAANGIPVLSGPELRDLILEEEVGKEIVLSLTRGGFPAEARVHFEAQPEGAPEVPLGATVESGVVVAEVAPGTAGSAAGLVRGDIITAIDDEEVFTGAQLRDAVQRLAGGAAVTIRYTRGGERREATTRLDEVPAAP